MNHLLLHLLYQNMHRQSVQGFRRKKSKADTIIGICALFIPATPNTNKKYINLRPF